MTQDWVDSVEEHYETLVKIAESDLPLSEDAKKLLYEYRSEKQDEELGKQECSECGEMTNKFVGECDHCGHDRWRSG